MLVQRVVERFDGVQTDSSVGQPADAISTVANWGRSGIAARRLAAPVAGFLGLASRLFAFGVLLFKISSDTAGRGGILGPCTKSMTFEGLDVGWAMQAAYKAR